MLSKIFVFISFFVFSTLVSLVYCIDAPHNKLDCQHCHSLGLVNNERNGLNLSYLCISCHRGGSIGKEILPFPANPYGTANIASPLGKGITHNFMGPITNVKAKATLPNGSEFDGNFVLSNLSCVSCHNPHKQNLKDGKFLRVSLDEEDKLCLSCHKEMDQKTDGFSHPIKLKIAEKEGYFVFPQFSSLKKVYIKKNNKITCTLCHSVHRGFSRLTTTYYEGDGYLLRTDNAEWLCLQCHKKPVHGNTKGSQDKVCKDCHSLHNPKNNSKLIKSEFFVSGKNKEVIYHKSDSPTDFYNREGTGICQICHRETKFFRSYSTDIYSITGTSLHNPNNLNCLDCHSHGTLKEFDAPKTKEKANVPNDAFKGCGSCHGYPPLKPSMGKGGLANNEGGTGSISEGAHKKHTSSDEYGYSCDTCHFKGMPETPIYDKKIQIGFNVLKGLYSGGIFLARSSIKNGYSFVNSKPETVISLANTSKCSNIYCHSNASPIDKATLYSEISWVDKNISCSSCHGDLNNSNLLSTKHIKHLQNPYNFKCDDCHNDTVIDSYEIKNKNRHVDGKKDVSFKIKGQYDVNRYCYVYCHSNGNGGLPEKPVNWTDNTSMQCDSCHRGTLSNFKQMSSAGHNRLVSNNWIRKYPCYYCHSDTVDENGNIKDYTKHINRVKDVKINSKWSIPGRSDPTYNPNTKVCTNVYCHSDGTTNPDNVKPFGWNDGRANCDTCHGHPLGSCSSNGCHDGKSRALKTGWKPEDIWKSAVPMYSNEGPGKPRANSHARHIETNFTCDKCHSATIIGGDCLSCHQEGIPSGSMTEASHLNALYHVNGRREVVLKDGGTYNPITKTCSNVSCHSGGADPQWGGSVNSAVICLNCHGTINNDIDDYDAFNGSQAKINLVQWTTTGHGRKTASGNYPSGNPPANFPGNPCWYCHDNSVLHKDPENPYRLKLHTQFEKRFEKECVYCHMERKEEECLNCHNSDESLASQLNSERVLNKHNNIYYLSGCLNNLCHKDDESIHKTGAGFWNYSLKMEIKKKYLFMGVCLKCHDDDSEGQCVSCHTVDERHKLGYDPGTGFIKPQKAKAAGTHYGYKHFLQGSKKGGKFCWDCHDPHGDSNIYMIHSKVAVETDGQFGKPTILAEVVFTRKISGSDYVKISPPYNGICNVCHSSGSQHYRRDGGDGHHLGKICTDCHNHKFTDSHSSGEKCNTCHINKPVPRHSSFGLPMDCTKCHSGTLGRRTNVMAQFNGISHHIQDVPVTNKHCYACHWEATPEGIVNNQFHEGYNTKTHISKKNAKVDLVIWGEGYRPTNYKLYSTAITFIAISSIGTPREKEQVQNINYHCLGCHSDKNNNTEPFKDCKTPNQYAWDRSSIDSRYSNKQTSVWGKYTEQNSANKNIVKSFSAHGNAVSNEGGFSPSTGVDGYIPNTRNGNRNVTCFDCHNSHGSLVTGVTSSYFTFNGTKNGGLLKDTTAGRSGYNITYRAQGKSDGINPYSVQAGQCFDCHQTENGGVTTPWGYKSTFGATQPIVGYYDTSRFGEGSSGYKTRHFYTSSLNVKGGHLKASSPLTKNSKYQIEGICSKCHDPHGISESIEDKNYALPLLKGTWLTSPYKDDMPPAHGPTGTRFHDDVTNNVNLDSKTFSSGKPSENDTKFAGLCLNCHPKNNLTDGMNQNSQWKSIDRIHETVKGWGKNTTHNFTCSKCHSPHTSIYPRLMVTNCLDYNHRGRVASGGYPGSSERFMHCHPQDGPWPKNYWNWKTPW